VLNSVGKTIGHDSAGQAVRAAQGFTDYLNSLLTADLNLWAQRHDIAAGLKDGSITIEYDLATAPGDGTSTITNLVIDQSRLDLEAIGG